MGLGFTIALLLIGMVRELVGAGTLFGMQVTPEAYNPVGIFVKAPGAFLVLAFLVAIMNAVGMKTRANKVVEGCDGCCAACSQSCNGIRRRKSMTSLIMIVVSSALVSNVVLSQFLGICSFLGVSRQIKTSASLGGAVIFVITIASAVASPLYMIMYWFR